MIYTEQKPTERAKLWRPTRDGLLLETREPHVSTVVKRAEKSASVRLDLLILANAHASFCRMANILVEYRAGRSGTRALRFSVCLFSTFGYCRCRSRSVGFYHEQSEDTLHSAHAKIQRKRGYKKKENCQFFIFS